MLVVGLFSLFMITRLYDSRLRPLLAGDPRRRDRRRQHGHQPVSDQALGVRAGASFSGFAGSLYAGYFRVRPPDQFEFSVSVMILAMVILGGIGNIYGVIGGALLIGSFDRILADRTDRPAQSTGREDHLGRCSGLAIGWQPQPDIGSTPRLRSGAGDHDAGAAGRTLPQSQRRAAELQPEPTTS